MRKALIIRFSSLGDIVQCQSCISYLYDQKFEQIDWLLKQEFAELVAFHPQIHQVICVPGRSAKTPGWLQIWRLSRQIFDSNYDLIYDAHNNLRSNSLRLFLAARYLGNRDQKFPNWICKSHDRWKKFLFFKFRQVTFEKPFSAIREYLKPILQAKNFQAPAPPQIFFRDSTRQKLRRQILEKDFFPFVAIAPNAQHDLKKWPLDHWKQLIAKSSNRFIILGGAQDLEPEILAQLFPDKIWNWAGKTSLEQTLALISLSQILVANDTGVLHMADQLGHPCVALIGPTAFGYPLNESSKVLEVFLPCKPCSAYGKNPCYISEKKKCLVSIAPEKVLALLP